MAELPDLIERGVELYRAGRRREARAALELAVSLDPSNGKARSYLDHVLEGSPLPASFGDRPEPPASPPPEPGASAPVPAAGASQPPAPPAEPSGTPIPAPAPPAPVPPEPPNAGSQRTADGTDVWLSAAKELFGLGDFTGSLELVEKVLGNDPDNAEARDYLRQIETTLVSMFESKLAPLDRVPRLAIKPAEVMWLNLDHRAGFLLAQIDGTVDYESLFALSGLSRLDTARILANLVEDGVITG